MGEDGNCLFRAISHQIYGTEEHHKLIREKCVEYMKVERDYFSPYIESSSSFAEYCKHMDKMGVWGGNVEIQAISEMYGRPIEIYAYDTKPMKTYSNQAVSKMGPIRLSYHQGSHYNSIKNCNKETSRLEILSKPGVIENERIKLSNKSRQPDAMKKTQELSDLKYTEKKIIDDALFNISKRVSK
eukprot:UN34852